MKDFGDIAAAWRRNRGENFALATLVRARGSSYRRPGARMLISANGNVVGSLSGGCLEEEVAAAAPAVLRTGEPQLMEFDTRRRYGCHGVIQILVEKISGAVLDQIAEQMEARSAFRIATDFQTGSRVLGFDEAPPNDDNFVQEIHPLLRLVILGDGPDSAPLRCMARLLGWDVVEVEQATQLPEEFDAWTAVVVKSHHYGRDYAALQRLLPLDLCYVGIVGPRRRRDQLLGDLLDGGAEFHAEIFAPAGLDLNAETPEEIALAIVSEIQHVFAGGSCASLRDRKTPIHLSVAAKQLSDATK